MSPEIIKNNVERVRERIANAATNAGRKISEITLVAVSKTKPTNLLELAYENGLHHFAENYAQEVAEKSKMLFDKALTWHFIGPIQSNKTKIIAANCDWVHSVDRERVAKRLSDQRSSNQDALNVCIQVNLASELSKAGLNDSESIMRLAEQIELLPRLILRGLMAIPRPTDNMCLQRKQFERVRFLMDSLNSRGLHLNTLSMGMSADLEAAILEGATHVRIGTDIFGARPSRG